MVAASYDTVRRRTRARARPLSCPFPCAQLLPMVPLTCRSCQESMRQAAAAVRTNRSCSSSEPRGRAPHAADRSSRRQRERHCGTAPSRRSDRHGACEHWQPSRLLTRAAVTKAADRRTTRVLSGVQTPGRHSVSYHRAACSR